MPKQSLPNLGKKKKTSNCEYKEIVGCEACEYAGECDYAEVDYEDGGMDHD